MNIETNGWGNSMIATKYVYQRVYGILDSKEEDMAYLLSRFLEELAHNYKADTNKLIGEEV